jgi:GNAT superfamily N-acetyltransferase
VLAVSDAIEVHDAIEPARMGQLLELYRTTWWAAHRGAADVERMLAGSDLVLALVDGASDRLVAFARVLTDFTYRAIVFDVIVAADDRGRGLGARLMDALVGHPRLARVESIELVCQPGLIAFYERWGFTARVGTSTLMRRSENPASYGDGGCSSIAGLASASAASASAVSIASAAR